MTKPREYEKLIEQQAEYYRARAPEYDEWFLRRGRYDRGPEWNGRWFAETAEVREALDAFSPGGDVLELACGTGLWTEQLIRHANRITAVDSSAEVLALNRARVHSERVIYRQEDIFAWTPDRRYDAVVFAFFLSHVPPTHFEGFWKLVAAALAPQGRVFLVDSKREPASTAADHVLPAGGEDVVIRRLNDGREYRVIKIFFNPAELASRLRGLGWNLQLRETANYFLYGSGERS